MKFKKLTQSGTPLFSVNGISFYKISENTKPNATPVSMFKFQDNKITGYTGTDNVVVIPETYSIKGYETTEETLFSQFDFEIKLWNGEANNYPYKFTFRDGTTYTVNSEIEYYNIQSELDNKFLENGSGTLSYPTPVCVEGNDVSITVIGERAFANNRNITSIYFNSNIEYIGNYAFQNCSNLVSVYFEGNTEFTSDAFTGCSSLFKTNTDGLVYIYDSNSSEPYFLQDWTGANTSILNILDGTKYVGSSYPNEVTSVSEIYFPSSVKGFTDIFMFNDWTGLTTLDLSQTCIENFTYNDGISGRARSNLLSPTYGADNLKYYYVPKSVRIVHRFETTTSVTNLISSGGGKFLGDRENTPLILVGSSANNVTLPDTCKGIARAGSTITNLTINEGLISIAACALQSCKSLGNVVFPQSLEYIGNVAFADCSSITSIHIPKNVSYLGWENSFDGCSGLESISVDEENQYYDSRNNCNAIVRKSDNYIITGCKNTVIPEGIEGINNYAFRGCLGLTEITIPKSVKTLCIGCFGSCSNLETVIMKSSEPPFLADYIYPPAASGGKILVPAGSIDKYKNATNWATHSDLFVEYELNE